MGMTKVDKPSLVKYWLDTAERDFQTVEHLFQTGDYHWGLFVGHLVLEKLLKALFIQKLGEWPPRIHDLARLAEKCGLKPDDRLLDNLELISRFNLSVRYPDTQQELYQICTREFALKVLETIQEIRTWLLSLIRPS